MEYIGVEFVNEGRRELITHHVETPREMKVIDYDARVGPGEMGRITLKVTLPKTKFYRKSVNIYNNDPTTDIQTIIVMGSVQE